MYKDEFDIASTTATIVSLVFILEARTLTRVSETSELEMHLRFLLPY